MAELADRTRLGKLVGMLGSSSAGERDNAVAAVDKALHAAGLSWGWLANLVERGEVPGDGDGGRIFRRLATDRLRAGLQRAWAMADGGATLVRDVLLKCESGRQIDAVLLSKALCIADEAVRRAR